MNSSNKFECKLSQHTCLGYDLITKKKCDTKTLIGFEYCNKHLKQFCNLEIKKSKLYPQIGYGVFAYKSINNGDMIVKYNGEFLNNIEYRIRYKNIYGPYAVYFNNNNNNNKSTLKKINLLNDGPYSIYFNQTYTIDSACTRGTASLINHKKKKKGSNARYSSKINGLFIYAIRDIKEGEEIFADYGDDYLFRKNFKTIK